MKRKRLAATAPVLVLAASVLAGCGDDGGRAAPSAQQGVGDVMQEQMQQDGPDERDSVQGVVFVGDDRPAYARPDYDLTAMNSDMVYATVYDMMANPSQYGGKVVKMAGPYYHTFYEVTNQDYFYVIIEDAIACCA